MEQGARDSAHRFFRSVSSVVGDWDSVLFRVSQNELLRLVVLPCLSL